MLKTGYQVSPLFTWVQHLGTNTFGETVKLIMQLDTIKLLYDNGLFVCKAIRAYNACFSLDDALQMNSGKL